MEVSEDRQTQIRADQILKSLTSWTHLQKDSIFCVRSRGAKTRAIARIYSFPQALQVALKTKPKYVIEVISEKFDKLSSENKDKVLIHELMHIPKTFSGALVPHKCFGRKLICAKTVDAKYEEFKRNYQSDS